MPRHNRVERRPGARVAIVIDSVEHTLTETAFLELMAHALRVVQALHADQARETSKDLRVD
jgi:hypothetical protein